jgi:hypothetical protein
MLVPPGDGPRDLQARWHWPPMLYAGRNPDGHEVRIHYFYTATIGPPHRVLDLSTELDRSYTTHVFDRGGPVDAEAVVNLWTREDAMPQDEARRRVREVLVVATHGESADPVGVVTVYLGRSDQLGMDAWYLRAFVAAEHRLTRVAWQLVLAARFELDRRHLTGEDTRAAAMLIEVENQALMHRLDYAEWHPADFTFIGETENGSHVRVHFLPGAMVPAP